MHQRLRIQRDFDRSHRPQAPEDSVAGLTIEPSFRHPIVAIAARVEGELAALDPYAEYASSGLPALTLTAVHRMGSILGKERV